MQQIPVTGYIKRFIEAQFGTGPYDLSYHHHHPLTVSFLCTHIYARLYPAPVAIERLNISLGSSDRLKKYFDEHEHIFNRGCFYCYQFFNTFYTEVDGRLESFNELRESEVDLPRKYNRRTAIWEFMKRYNLDDEQVCQFESLYRYYSFYNARKNKHKQARVLGFPNRIRRGA